MCSDLELKVRVGRVELVHVDRLVGFGESWEKSRLGASSHASAGRWLDVHKQTWYLHAGEISRVSLGGTRWWTVAVETGRDGLPARCRELLDPFIDLVAASGPPHSYASWLLERDGGRT